MFNCMTFTIIIAYLFTPLKTKALMFWFSNIENICHREAKATVDHHVMLLWTKYVQYHGERQVCDPV